MSDEFVVSRAVKHGFTVYLLPPRKAAIDRARQALADARAARLTPSKSVAPIGERDL